MNHIKLIVDIDVDHDFSDVHVVNALNGLLLFSGTIMQFRFWLANVQYNY